MKLTVVWKDRKLADTTWYCVEKTTFIPENGPFQFFKIIFDEDSDVQIMFIDVNEIERIYYKKIPSIA